MGAIGKFFNGRLPLEKYLKIQGHTYMYSLVEIQCSLHWPAFMKLELELRNRKIKWKYFKFKEHWTILNSDVSTRMSTVNIYFQTSMFIFTTREKDLEELLYKVAL